MAILAFQKPEKVIMLESTSSFGKFEFRPLEPGFGMTVGNALRRILLSSLEGYAITTVKVAGVDHEFAAIPGVMEGMIDIILNLKQVRFIRTVDNQDAEKVPVLVSFGAVFNAPVRVFSLCLSRLAGFEKDCFSRYAAP